MPVADRPVEPTAIRTDLGAIFVSMELSRSKWLITSLSPGSGEKMSKHTVNGGDVAGLLDRFSHLRDKAKARTERRFPIIVIQEAGLDGFWIHRVLEAEGFDRDIAPPPTGEDGQARWRDIGACAAGLQARRAAGVRHGQGAQPRR